MTSPSPLHVQIPQDAIYLSPSTSSSDQSNIENRDILQEAIISINLEDFIWMNIKMTWYWTKWYKKNVVFY
jgi:hypothetical protein